eukprot:387228-Rhodomonas_salina.5
MMTKPQGILSEQMCMPRLWHELYLESHGTPRGTEMLVLQGCSFLLHEPSARHNPLPSTFAASASQTASQNHHESSQTHRETAVQIPGP